MNNQHGGYIKNSFVSQIISDISKTNNQTDDIKRHINKSITNTGHGSLFFGSSNRLEEGEQNIRILVGAHFSHGKLQIGVFGGKCEPDEMTIDTVIRETIEEIFNFPATDLMIRYIRDYLNDNTEFYYIYQVSRSDIKPAYSYIFDVSILGDFIRIIKNISQRQNTIFLIPANEGMANVENYLESNIKIKGCSSFDSKYNSGTDTTIKLVEFMKTRYISWKLKKMQMDRGVKKRPGMDEIKYLSFVSLKKIVAAIPSKHYNLFNFTTNQREYLEMQWFLIKILTKDIIDIIRSYNIVK